MITMYGIKNCDTIKKARVWLENAGVTYSFHDYKKDGLSNEQLAIFVQAVGWESLLNKRGTTWRALPDDVKNTINEASAVALMLSNPSIIKRPLLNTGSRFVLGFTTDEYAALFSV